jgi:large conductance mechanosensitive channel
MSDFRKFLSRGNIDLAVATDMSGFRKFLLRGNIIDLAVAVVMGVAFNGIIQALVKYMVTPLISAIVGNRINFTSLYFPIHGTKFYYGYVINAAVSFLVIAAVIYWLIVAPTARLTALANRNKAATERACPECLSLIPVAAKRCMYCTSEVPPVPPPTITTPPRRLPQRRHRHGSLSAD